MPNVVSFNGLGKALVQVREGDIMAALSHGRKELMAFLSDASLSAAQRKLLSDTIAIVVYSDVHSSPVGYLLSPAHRTKTAILANDTILQHLVDNPAPTVATSANGVGADLDMISGEQSFCFQN